VNTLLENHDLIAWLYYAELEKWSSYWFYRAADSYGPLAWGPTWQWWWRRGGPL